ncbi:glycosyltransferase [Desertivirga arenae]|uniref:glycosyltransferase n=1 Tax=Desertivirga arenae TaxID=2810309 RepID=UPI001A9725CD|nr:glycosyltransferase [Pedobacter sp. SYSU D00823]
MKISISTIGTRGDVQPYATLGKALAANGHDVTLSTSKNFKSLVEGYGINFHPVDVDYQEVLNSNEGSKIMKANLFAIQRNLDKLIYPLIEQSLNECYQLAQSSDLFIYRPKTLSDIFTGKLKTKCIKAAVVPATEETAAFINPIISGFRIPEFLYKWSFKLNNLRYQLLSKPISNFCEQNGITDHTPQDPHKELSLYGISEHFLERPRDWSSVHQLTGFWFPEAEKQNLSDDLTDYLSSGTPPILISFGSMQIKKEVASMILQSASEIKERFLIVASWSDWKTEEEIPSNVHIINSAPFETLFPKVKAVMHHGGIGTTAECLRAGKPMFVCPVLYPVGDQYFWGDLAYKKGLGVKPVPVNSLTPGLFKTRIEQLLSISTAECKKLAQKISEENGVQKAVELIEKYVA